MAKLHRDNAGYIGCSHEETQDPYYSYNKLSLPLSAATETVIRSEKTFAVTVQQVSSVNKYFIDGAQQATLALKQGEVYTFDLSDSSVASHPFRIRKVVNTVANSLTSGLPSGYSAITSSQYTGTVSDIETDNTSSLYATNNHIDFDLGAVKTIHSFKAVFTSNDISVHSADYRIELYSDAGFTTLVAASDTAVAERTTDIKTIDHDFGGVQARYVRWSYTGGGRTSYLRYFYPYADTSDVVLTTSGTQGQSGATAKYIVPFGTLGSYEYYCASHAGMGANVSVSANAGMFTGALPILKTTDQFGASAPTGGSAVLVEGDPSSSTSNPFGSGNGYSIQFDGNDRLKILGGTIVGDFTYECWFNMDSGTSGYRRILSTNEPLYSSEQTMIRLHTNGNIQFYAGNGTPEQQGGTGSTSTWYHAAIVRSGDTISYYIDGSRQGTDTYSASNDIPLTQVCLAWGYGSEYFTGKISNVRVSNNARYTGVSHTVPTSTFSSDSNTLLLAAHTNSFTTAQGTWASPASGWPGTQDTASDPYAANLVLALPLNGGSTVDVSNSFNSSSTTKVFTITGSITSNSSHTYYGSSADFNGSSRLGTTTLSYDFRFERNDFTIEYWATYDDISAGNSQVGDFQSSLTSGGITTSYTEGIHNSFNPAGQLNFSIDSTTCGSISGISTGTWYHIACVRENGVVRLYKNGILQSTVNNGGSIESTYMCVGGYYSNSYLRNGLMQDFRVYKGVAKYKANFSPVTSLSVTDQSSSAHAVTNNGASFQTSVKKFYDGAAEFNGSSTKLTIPASAEFDFGTGDFTIELWAYATGTSGTALMSSGDYYGSGSGNWLLRRSSSTNLAFATYNGTSTEEYEELAAATSLNKWHHIAVTRSGTLVQVFVDGSPGETMTVSKSLVDGGNNGIFIGYGKLNGYWPGYIQDVCIYKGIAKYTSSFSPPERSIQGTARRYPSGVYVVS